MRTLSSLLSSLLFCVSSLQAAEAIVSRDAQIDNVQLHYLTAGHGSATVILLHGFAETSRMWRPIIPLLAEKFTVIAPDLPGIGDSSIPAKTGMLIAAQQIHELVRSLKIEKARVVGHDIGLMVAYAYAAQFPNETEKLAVMDAFLPGVEGWEAIYDAPNVWHFRFNGEYPEKLVQGRERTYFEYFWNVFAADETHSIPEAERKAYTAAYARPGRMRAAWAYFASWPQLATEFAPLSKTKLTMPVLSIGGEKSLGNQLGAQMKLVADNVTVIVLQNAGHWIIEVEVVVVHPVHRVAHVVNAGERVAALHVVGMLEEGVGRVIGAERCAVGGDRDARRLAHGVDEWEDFAGHVVIVLRLQPAAVKRMRVFVAERIALHAVDAEDSDSPRVQIRAESANHALTFLLMLVAATGWEGEDGHAVMSVNIDAHVAAETV